MELILGPLVEHGYLILALWVLADEGGLPIPVLPALVVAGILAGMGTFNIVAVILLTTAVTLAMNVIWFWIGRRYGSRVLRTLCRVSLEPDFCVRRTNGIFERYGSVSLLVSSFVPGLQTVAPPLAGATGLAFPTFLGLRIAGSLLWACALTLPGYVFAHEAYGWVETASAHAELIFVAVITGIVGFVGYKFLHRQWFLRAVRTGTVDPHELNAELAQGGDPRIVDLRHRSERDAFPYVIPNALFIPFEDMDEHVEVLAGHRDIILYCT